MKRRFDDGRRESRALPGNSSGVASRSAFTLVEIMIVVAILGVVLGMGIPSMFRAMSREGIRAATSDVIEACAKARSAAILSGAMIELQILPESRQFSVQAASVRETPASVLDPLPEEFIEAAPPPQAAPPGLTLRPATT
ncbi:MAG: prepilin-type N-terminal cleavage/methylation domain-containing protein [Rhodobacteraceae bacterium]|nr:prepilin-type N-terminal cleavage/methylation domain-containing protein [Paracoccaceae bacterium]